MSMRALGAIASVAVLAILSGGCSWISEVSVDSSGTEGNAPSGGFAGSTPPAISANGRYIAFTSVATSLVESDSNNAEDVFVRDTALGTTSLVSVDSSETPANGPSNNPAISADGRYVTFDSDASNLVPNDTNETGDVFVRDTVTGMTSLVNVMGFDPAISGDGRYVAFGSGAALVPDDTNNNYDVFVRDRALGTTTRVSVDSSGAQADADSRDNAISADGRYVTFDSPATNLVPGDTNRTWDVFIHDTATGLTSRVSVDSTGAQANLGGDTPAISADGRYITFTSRATNLVADDTNGGYDTFLRDTLTGTTSRVSVDSGGAQGNDGSFADAISADGRYITFTSVATNLVAGDTNDSQDVFARDTLLGTTSRASVGTFGAQGDGSSRSSAMSADGRYIAFVSNATNLVAGHIAVWEQVYVRANPLPTVSVVAPGMLPRLSTTAVTITGTGFQAGAVLVVTGDGIDVTNVMVVSPTEVTADVAVQGGATVGARSVLVGLRGTGSRSGMFDAWGLCSNCITVT